MAGFQFQGPVIPRVLSNWLLPIKMTFPILAVFVSLPVVASQCGCFILAAVVVPGLTASVHLLGNSSDSTILRLYQTNTA